MPAFGALGGSPKPPRSRRRAGPAAVWGNRSAPIGRSGIIRERGQVHDYDAKLLFQQLKRREEAVVVQSGRSGMIPVLDRVRACDAELLCNPLGAQR